MPLLVRATRNGFHGQYRRTGDLFEIPTVSETAEVLRSKFPEWPEETIQERARAISRPGKWMELIKTEGQLAVAKAAAAEAAASSRRMKPMTLKEAVGGGAQHGGQIGDDVSSGHPEVLKTRPRGTPREDVK